MLLGDGYVVFSHPPVLYILLLSLSRGASSSMSTSNNNLTILFTFYNFIYSQYFDQNSSVKKTTKKELCFRIFLKWLIGSLVN